MCEASSRASFGQDRSSPEWKEDEAGFLGGFLPLTWDGERLLHKLWQMLSAAQPCHCCSLAGGEERKLSHPLAAKEQGSKLPLHLWDESKA